jgi:membrane protein involved in colicin uptake
VTWHALIKNINAATQALAAQQSVAAAAGSTAGAPSADEETARAELRIIELDESAAKLKDDLVQHRAIVAREEATAAAIGDHVTDLRNALAESNNQLQQMREAAGLSDSSGVGAEKKKLTDDLNEARTRLQYLEDTSKGTKQDLDAIETQKKVVDDLTVQLTDAEKRLRIADYELTHSDAWRKELQAIADQQAVIKAEQQKQAEEQKRVDALKADLAAREAEAQKLADERAKQQAILDKKQQEAQAAATAQRKAELEKELGLISEATQLHVLTLHAAAAEAVVQVRAAVDQASTQLQGTVTQATQTIGDTAAAVVTTASTAIAANLSAAMQSLLGLVSGGPQNSTDVQSGPNSRDVGSPFAGQFFGDNGEIAGGSIGDPTYASFVQAFADSKQRYLDDNAPGKQKYQAGEALAQQQLEAIWVKTGGFARFHETLEQIYRMLKDQTNAAKASPRGTPRPPPPPPPPTSGARFTIHLPTMAPRPPTGDSLATLIRTGRF